MHEIDYAGPLLAAVIAAVVIIYVGGAFLASLRDRRFNRSASARRLEALGRAANRDGSDG